MMLYENLPYYLSKKIHEAHLVDYTVNSENDVLELFALLRAYFPSLAMRGLYDLFAHINSGIYPDINEQNKLRNKFDKLTPIYKPRENSEVRFFMQQAYDLALTAFNNNEVPVGAVVVYENETIGRGFNQTRSGVSSMLHAEIIAINEAQKHLNSTYLQDCDLFVTLEPCLMCSGAIINSRIKRVYYGAKESKTGACDSQYRVFDNRVVNHHTQVLGGVMAEQCTELMQNFFSAKRS
jgi:tRNA(adenine34) deaminase